MKDFKDIKELWEKQPMNPLDYGAVIKIMKADRKAYVYKLFIQTVSVVILLALIISIWIFKPFTTWTTHLSMALLCGCLVYFLIMQYRDYESISIKGKHLMKPKDFIDSLKVYKKESYLLNKINFKIYTIGIGIAFLFILAEMYFIIPLWLLLLFAGLSFAWFLLSYEFLMKGYIRSETKRVEEMINQLEKIQKQFKE